LRKTRQKEIEPKSIFPGMEKAAFVLLLFVKSSPGLKGSGQIAKERISPGKNTEKAVGMAYAEPE